MMVGSQLSLRLFSPSRPILNNFQPYSCEICQGGENVDIRQSYQKKTFLDHFLKFYKNGKHTFAGQQIMRLMSESFTIYLYKLGQLRQT